MADDGLAPVAVGGARPAVGFEVLNSHLLAGHVVAPDREIIVLPPDVQAVARGGRRGAEERRRQEE